MKTAWIAILATGLCAQAAVIGDVSLTRPPTPPDERMYLAAARSFQGGHWATSVRWLGELIERHPDSPRRAQAVSLMAQSHYQMGQFRESYGVLSNGRLAAGDLADEYLYWMAECRVGQGNLEAAGQIYSELLQSFPKSDHALEAVLGMGFVAAQVQDWAKIVSLLLPAESEFQRAVGEGLVSVQLQEGGLLLAEALLQQKDVETAMVWVKRLPRAMDAERGWRRDLLLARIAMQSGERAVASQVLEQLKNTLVEQKAPESMHAKVDGVNAALMESAQEWREAANLQVQISNGMNLPADQRAQAALNAVRLYQHCDEIDHAIAILKKVSVDPEMKSVHAIAQFIQGEFELLMRGDTTIAQRHFRQALASSESKELIARAQFGIGRCLLKSNNATEAHEAFLNVIGLGGQSNWVAQVRYVDALALLAEGKSEQAFETLALIDQGVSNDLLEKAKYLQLKTAMAQGDAAQMIELLDEAKAVNSSLLAYSILASAQGHVTLGRRENAAALLVEFREQNPGSPLLAAAELENIRLIASEGRWTEVVALYKKWLADHPANELVPSVKLDRAWALAQSGQILNAAAAYRELAHANDNSKESFAAQMWLADQDYQSKTNRLAAEKRYLAIAGATNSPIKLRHRSLFMAGRAALARQGFEDARKIFQDLLNDQALDRQNRVEATFALGDLTMVELGGVDEGALLGKLTQSTNAFHEIIQESPTNSVAARAWGRIGDGCLLISKTQPGYLLHAEIAYRQSLAISGETSPEVRSQSHLGLAYTLERGATGTGLEEKLNSAADHAMTVFYGRHLEAGERNSAYWQTQGGLMAIRILERLKRFQEAIGLCDELAQQYPGMTAGLAARKKRYEAALE